MFFTYKFSSVVIKLFLNFALVILFKLLLSNSDYKYVIILEILVTRNTGFNTKKILSNIIFIDTQQQARLNEHRHHGYRCNTTAILTRGENVWTPHFENAKWKSIYIRLIRDKNSKSLQTVVAYGNAHQNRPSLLCTPLHVCIFI